MNKRFSYFLSMVALLFVTSNCLGQEQNVPEMADQMRSNGKIYVVVVVCLLILIGLFIYAMTIDRKLSKLEKNKE